MTSTGKEEEAATEERRGMMDVERESMRRVDSDSLNKLRILVQTLQKDDNPSLYSAGS